MANNKLQLAEDYKILLHEHEGKTYIALQNIDECDVAEEIANSVTGVTLVNDCEVYANSEDTFDFGCNYEWVAVEFVVVNDNGYYRVITRDFIGNVPGR